LIEHGRVTDHGTGRAAEGQRHVHRRARVQGAGHGHVRRTGIGAAGVVQREAGGQVAQLELQGTGQRGAAGVGDRHTADIFAGGAVIGGAMLRQLHQAADVERAAHGLQHRDRHIVQVDIFSGGAAGGLGDQLAVQVVVEDGRGRRRDLLHALPQRIDFVRDQPDGRVGRHHAPARVVAELQPGAVMGGGAIGIERDRKVGKTNVFSIHSRRYECPVDLREKTIQVRYDRARRVRLSCM